MSSDISQDEMEEGDPFTKVWHKALDESIKDGKLKP